MPDSLVWTTRARRFAPLPLVTAFAYFAVGLCALVVFAALKMPVLGVAFDNAGTQVTVTAWDGRTRTRVAPDTPVTLAGTAGAFTAPAAELVPDYAPDGPAAGARAWYEQRDRLAVIAAPPPRAADLARLAAGHASSSPSTPGRLVRRRLAASRPGNGDRASRRLVIGEQGRG